MALLDVTIVNIAIPAIMEDLDATVSKVSWVLNAYNLAMAALFLSMGRVADKFGQKLVFVTGLATVHRLLAALRSGADHRLADRLPRRPGRRRRHDDADLALDPHGRLPPRPARHRGRHLGRAGHRRGRARPVHRRRPRHVRCLALDLLHQRADRHRRVRLRASSSSPSASAPTHGRRRHRRHPDLDRRSLLPRARSHEGNDWGWTSWRILLLFGIAIVCYPVFYLWETRTSSPMFDFRLLRIRSFTAANTAMMAMGAALGGAMLLLVIFMVNVMGYSELRGGLAMTFMPFTALFVAPIAGRLVDRIGPRFPAAIGSLLFGIGLAAARAARRRVDASGTRLARDHDRLRHGLLDAEPRRGGDGIAAAAVRRRRRRRAHHAAPDRLSLGVAVVVAIFTSAIVDQRRQGGGRGDAARRRRRPAIPARRRSRSPPASQKVAAAAENGQGGPRLTAQDPLAGAPAAGRPQRRAVRGRSRRPAADEIDGVLQRQDRQRVHLGLLRRRDRRLPRRHPGPVRGTAPRRARRPPRDGPRASGRRPRRRPMATGGQVSTATAQDGGRRAAPRAAGRARATRAARSWRRRATSSRRRLRRRHDPRHRRRGRRRSGARAPLLRHQGRALRGGDRAAGPPRRGLRPRRRRRPRPARRHHRPRLPRRLGAAREPVRLHGHAALGGGQRRRPRADPRPAHARGLRADRADPRRARRAAARDADRLAVHRPRDHALRRPRRAARLGLGRRARRRPGTDRPAVPDGRPEPSARGGRAPAR